MEKNTVNIDTFSSPKKIEFTPELTLRFPLLIGTLMKEGGKKL